MRVMHTSREIGAFSFFSCEKQRRRESSFLKCVFTRRDFFVVVVVVVVVCFLSILIYKRLK
jgi:hypothetical protein